MSPREQVLQTLRSDVSSLDAIDSAMIELMHCGDAGDAELIEPFLARSNPPELVRRALQLLCSSWGLTGRYQAVLVDYLDDRVFDPFGEVRQMAMFCLGEHVDRSGDLDMLARLVAIAEDNGEHDDDRRDATLAVGLAVGVPWRDLPGLDDPCTPTSPRGAEWLHKAHNLLGG